MGFLLTIITLVVFIANLSVEPKPESTAIPTDPASTPDSVVIGITDTPPTMMPSVEPTPTPLPPQVSSNNFIYPDSRIISQSGSEIKIESKMTADKITQWYEDKIKAEGFNVTSFVKTSTNGNILNKLAAAKNGTKIQVNIEKDAGNPKVSINIILTTDNSL